MKGEVIDFSVQDSSGIISGDDGMRYSFTGSEWRGGGRAIPFVGMRVDFEIYENVAVEIFPDTQSHMGNRIIRGRIIDYSVQTNSGLISGDSGMRYSFSGTEWHGSSNAIPSAGTEVEFTAIGEAATGIYPVSTGAPATPYRPIQTAPAYPNAKSKIAAGILAILLGGLGIHKFYLGYTAQGLILLAASLISFSTWFIGIGVFGTLTIYAIILTEGIIYLTKSDDEFHQTYVANKKPWF